MTERQIEAGWTAKASVALRGKTVKEVRYLSKEEAQSLGWRCRPLVIVENDDSLVFPSADDEGNDGGALFGQTASGGDLSFPVL